MHSAYARTVPNADLLADRISRNISPDDAATARVNASSSARLEPNRCAIAPAVTPASAAISASVSSLGASRDMARCAAAKISSSLTLRGRGLTGA